MDEDNSPRCELNILTYYKKAKNLSENIRARLGSALNRGRGRNLKRLQVVEDQFRKYLIERTDDCEYQVDALETVLKSVESKLDHLSDAEVEEHVFMLEEVFGGKMLCLDSVGHELAIEMKMDRKKHANN